MSIANALRLVVVLGVVAGGLAVATSCGSFEAPLVDEVFAIEGAHSRLDCTSCHVEAEPPFTPLSTDCLVCHEEDRKSPQHYAGQTCVGADGTGCHTSADDAWADAAGNINHDFLPLELAHALECIACHEDPAGGNDLDGQADICWSCHEQDRPDDGHYASELDPLDPLYRWDCGPCHSPTPGFGLPFRRHLERAPHGAVTKQGSNCVAKPEEEWVWGCDTCHQDLNDLEQFQCLVCHGDAHRNQTTGDQQYEDAECTGCHVSAQPTDCDSLE